jgi:hypothetical protein
MVAHETVGMEYKATDNLALLYAPEVLLAVLIVLK